jgi:two-component system NtrC family sensor kinase
MVDDSDTPATVIASPVPQVVDAEESRLEREFQKLPSITIRARLIGAFALLFLLMFGITAAALVSVSFTRARLLFLDEAGRYLFEVEQARRFEKNYFLYGSGLPDAINSVQESDIQLERIAAELGSVVGVARLEMARTNLATYSNLLHELATTGDPAPPSNDIEARVRKAGARALADAEEMIDRERLDVHGMLHTSSAIAVGFLLTMSLLMIAIVAFLTRAVLAPLNRFITYTSRIGSGDYTPISPVRPYRDEFSNLALAVNHMLRELKHRQEELFQAAKLAGVGTLTAGVAHELNNPLNNISLATETLIDDYQRHSDEERLYMLEQIATQVERAGATVRNLLDFTRQDRPILTRVSLPEVIRKAVRLLENELALGNVELELDLPEHLPPVHGNARNLQQVFVNLFLNAIQAMPQGGVLEVRIAIAENGWLRIDVCDTGVGISADDLSRVFDPFFTTKDPGEGTGLGLSVSYSIVKEHQGRITVTSSENNGTTFSVFLPHESGSEQQNHVKGER